MTRGVKQTWLEERSAEVRELAMAGITDEQIARQLGISVRTVIKHRRRTGTPAAPPPRSAISAAYQRRDDWQAPEAPTTPVAEAARELDRLDDLRRWRRCGMIVVGRVDGWHIVRVRYTGLGDERWDLMMGRRVVAGGYSTREAALDALGRYV